VKSPQPYSLVDRWFSLYLDTFRDCYESWVVYNFLSLCLAYVGGPGNVVNRMAGKEVTPSWRGAVQVCVWNYTNTFCYSAQVESTLPIACKRLVSTTLGAYKVKNRFQAFAFKWVNMYRYVVVVHDVLPAAAARGGALYTLQSR
jgi:hypothetical protein